MGATPTLQNVIDAGTALSPDFWLDFRPVERRALADVESALEITLPDDFIEFYQTIGWGDAPDGDLRILPPDEIIDECSVPIYLMTGSRFGSDPWATPEEHRKLWISSGRINPNPEQFTDEALSMDDVMLWDLLLVGDDMSCGKHFIYVGENDTTYRYCMVHSASPLWRCSTFFEGMIYSIEEIRKGNEEFESLQS